MLDVAAYLEDELHLPKIERFSNLAREPSCIQVYMTVAVNMVST